MIERAYLDWNASAPLRPEARDAVIAAFGFCGNPSSVHGEGRTARRLVEDAREQVAALVGASPRNVVFTSGGTEANVLALSPAVPSGPSRDRIAQDRIDCLLVSAVEHPSVLAGGDFGAEAVEILPAGADGRIDLGYLAGRLAALHTAGRRPLVSLMAANNETGIVQPVAEAARLVHDAGGILHVDAIQAAGRIPCDINDLGADLLTLSGHKLGAPKGVGALVRRDDARPIHPRITGGGQERGLRAGTENVPAIAGFGAAAAAARTRMVAEAARMRALRGRIEAGIAAATPAAVIFGRDVERLPNTTLVALSGMKAETTVIALDLGGAAVSSGSACSSGKVKPSHVLAAMGVPASLAQAAIRISVGPSTTESEVDRFLDAWIGVSRALLKSHGMAA
jgi:cysteine desulfurase